MAQEITVHQPMPLADMDRMANAIAKSGLFGVKTPDQALALMLISQAEGRHPALAARDYDIIQGKPTKKAEAMVRDFQAAGGRIEWHRLDNEMADATFSHELGGTFRCTWDMKRAADAGLAGKEMWKKFPRQMLRSRCVSEGVRTVLPMATSGMCEPGEIGDIDHGPAEMRDVTPPRPQREASSGSSVGNPQEGQPTTMSGEQQPDAIGFVSWDGEAHEFPRNLGGIEKYVEAFEAAFGEAVDKAAWFADNEKMFHELAVGATGSRGKSARCEKLAARFDAVATMIEETLAGKRE